MGRCGKVIGILLWLLLAAGCASTQLESQSFVDQSAPPKTHNRILVMAKVSDFTMRTQAEQALRGTTDARIYSSPCFSHTHPSRPQV